MAVPCYNNNAMNVGSNVNNNTVKTTNLKVTIES